MEIDRLEFEDDLIRVTDTTGYRVALGKFKCVMTLNKGAKNHYIEWYYAESNEVIAEIELWTQGNIITDYDGVSILPYQAQALLKRNGFVLEGKV